MISKRKVFKIAAWLLGCLAGVYLLLLFIAGVYINHQQQRILQYITTELSRHIRGNIAVRTMDVSPWTSFPSIDFRLNDLVISDSMHHLPVLTLQTASTSFSLFQLIGGKTVVSNLLLENGMLHLLTDSTGYSNSFLRNDSSAVGQQSGAAAVSIAQIIVKNISISVEDKIKEKEISFIVHSLHAHIVTGDSLRFISMTEKITMKKGLGFNLAKGAFLENQSINGNWNLQYNADAKTISFTDARVDISKHPFVLNGQFSFQSQNPSFRIGFAVKQIPYTLAKEIVSVHIREKLAMYDVRLPLDADGAIEGSLLPAHEPAVDINWQIKNNTVVTEAGTFGKCNFDGNFMNSVSPGADHVDSNSRISFRNLSAEWDGIPFTADSGNVTNLDSARLQVRLRSRCKLEDLDSKLGMQDIAFKKGDASFDLLYDGPIVRDKSMLQDIRGSVTIKDGAIDYTPRGFNFIQCNGTVLLFKDSIRMDDFSCKYGDNQFNVVVHGSNVRRAMVAGDASKLAVIDCFVRAPFIDLDDFTSLFGQEKKRNTAKKVTGSFAATARSIDAMLDNSIIGVHVNAAACKHGSLHATNLDAVVSFEPQYWALKKISMNLAGGTIACSGKVLLAADNKHQAFFKIKVDNADISKLLFAFDNFGQEAITSTELSGRFSTIASLESGIDVSGHIVPASIKGEVDFSLQQGVLQNYDPLNRLKSFVFKNRDMSNVRFAELKDKFKINGNMISVQRMEIQSSAFRLFLEGNYGLAKTNTDLLIQVPFSNLNGNSFDEEKDPINKGVSAKSGASIWLRAVNGEDGKVKVKLTMKKKVKTTEPGT
ncbi:MAG: AsmA-like C-terminal region-containing protein [Bacteroidota bacterium]